MDTPKPTIDLGEVGVFIHYGSFQQGSTERYELDEFPLTRIEIGTKFVVRARVGDMSCLHLMDGRMIWVSNRWLDDETHGGRFVKPL